MDYLGAFWLSQHVLRIQKPSDWQQRHDQAWEAAYRVAAQLREQYGAARILAIDSLVRPGPFADAFDIHLAVTNIPADSLAAALDTARLLASDFDVDLI